MDRARHARDRRSGHDAPLRKALVREARSLLLGCRALLQTVRRERSRRAAAERHLCATRHARSGVARIASLRRGNRLLAAASASDHRWHDRLLSRRCHGHAFQRHAHDCHGLRRRRPWPHAQREFSRHSTNALARPCPFRFFPRPRRPRERPRRHHSLRRRRFFLGAHHQALARRLPPLSSRRSRVFFPHQSSLVHPLRPPQPRFLPHLHHRAQFQALPHPRIPAHPALLVLHPCPLGCCFSLDRNFSVVARQGHRQSCAHAPHCGIHVATHLLGRILPTLFFCITIETSRLHPPCFSSDWSVDDSRIHTLRPGLFKILSTGAPHIGIVPLRFIWLG